MTKLKPGVCLAGVEPVMMLAVLAAQTYCSRVGVECVVTSGTDGRHSANSLHYVGRAFDFRTRDMQEGEKDAFCVYMQEVLNGERGNRTGDWDVVLESTHLHVEYDPT